MRNSATFFVSFLILCASKIITNVSGKANNVAALQREREESETISRYVQMKKEFKDDSVVLRTLLQGDVQRTKNVLQHYPKYQRMFQYKQSYEVVDELEYQEFLKQKKLDHFLSQRHALMRQYEENLVFSFMQSPAPKTYYNDLNRCS